MFPIELIDWAPNPEQLYGASELRDILIKTIEELRPVLRAVFVLQDIEGLSTAETAEVLNLSQSAVKSRLLRARLQLREHLNKHFGEQLRPDAMRHVRRELENATRGIKSQLTAQPNAAPRESQMHCSHESVGTQ